MTFSTIEVPAATDTMFCNLADIPKGKSSYYLGIQFRELSFFNDALKGFYFFLFLDDHGSYFLADELSCLFIRRTYPIKLMSNVSKMSSAGKT